MKKITYDDTRDCAIRINDKLINAGFLEEDDDYYFEIQDTIQDEYNRLLGLDIDDQFEVGVQKDLIPKKETRVFFIPIYELEDKFSGKNISNWYHYAEQHNKQTLEAEMFLEKAEELGNVLSLEEFVLRLNLDIINGAKDYFYITNIY